MVGARASATSAAARAGVLVRALGSTADSFACERFLCEVWRTGPGSPPLAADVVKAIADAGNYVAGAIDGTGELLAAAVGLWGPPRRPGMHSHIAGVSAAARGRDVGFALKLDQRAHVLENGAEEITWTFDPLVARNAHFNIRKLGGTVDAYLVDHYGPLSDGLNGTDASDRLLLRWDLLGERARAACDERAPRPVADETVLVAVPPDVEGLRIRDPAAAGEWRLAVRDALGGLLAEGARVVDFDRSACGYVLARGER